VKVVYFVHNVGDPAVARRVEMLRAGGAGVVVIGFRRDQQATLSIPGVEVIELGQSFDARFLQRSTLVLRALAQLSRHRKVFGSADVIVARNLEMLVLAARARYLAARPVPLVYESLDIHRLLLANGLAGRGLRALERQLMKSCDLLIVSSPAFLSRYFQPVQDVQIPHLLIENRMVRLNDTALDDRDTPEQNVLQMGPPWRIGWFGMIRCQRSLDILTELTRAHPGLVEVVIRGRPSLSEFRDFDGQVAGAPGVQYLGVYRPEDLPAMYRDVHFTWAIDYFEAGQNSDWLLPNRLYEGSAQGAVPIALSSVETGRWLAARDAGLRLDAISDLRGVLEAMTSADFAQLRSSVAEIPFHDLIATQADCVALVERLGALDRCQ
jgi:succinoglycan biosynthesis protein ExoL